MNGLLDTSVFVAREQRRSVGRLPERAAVSVVTVAELHLGVLLATDVKTRALRTRTLAEVERAFDPLPIDVRVARRFGEMVAEARRRKRRPKVLDVLIAATAAANELPVYSQDRDFGEIPGARVVLV
ncbi:MAG: PIN domain-containing protein [Acidobacteria bacterium]|nr:PIN domain-containing protein [Acidobacteriota bacterium]